jgi:two-component system response regulator AlgR
VRILVVDDEPLARARLIRMLIKPPGVEVAGEADGGTAALALVEQLKPDLLMLDLEMPGLDGLGVAEKKGLPPIVFTTGHPGYATHAFELDAVDYLLKPIRQDRLEQALAKARRRLEPAPPAAGLTLIVQDGRATHVVDPLEVEVFRATEKYTELTYRGEELLARESLDTLEERFAGLGFVRVHRAALVRKDAIVKLERKGDELAVQLKSGASVEVSRRRAAELKRLLGLRE